MPARYQLELTESQEAELRSARNRHDKHYIRERAAAILKVAQGQSIRQVAQNGLLRPREPEQVSDWVKRYQQEGFRGLFVREGGGRKPAFFPQRQADGQE